MAARLTLLCLFLAGLVPAVPARAASGDPDRLAESLDSLALDKGQIGTRPLGYWTRFPIAFGWDYTNALLVDKAGNDLYDGGQSCVALSTGRSHVMLYDAEGDTVALSGRFWRNPSGALHGGDFETGRVPDFEWWDVSER